MKCKTAERHVKESLTEPTAKSAFERHRVREWSDHTAVVRAIPCFSSMPPDCKMAMNRKGRVPKSLLYFP